MRLQICTNPITSYVVNRRRLSAASVSVNSNVHKIQGHSIRDHKCRWASKKFFMAGLRYKLYGTRPPIDAIEVVRNCKDDELDQDIYESPQGQNVDENLLN